MAPPPELHTGGAAGSDAFFEKCALDAGHAVVVHTFDGHCSFSYDPRNDTDQRRTHSTGPEEHRALDKHVRAAARRLGRRLPADSERGRFVRQLLRRNARLGLCVARLYAVADFENEKRSGVSVNVAGGTAWACQVFADAAAGQGAEGATGLFLFSVREQRWWQRCAPPGREPHWRVVAEVPAPDGRYGGIGARGLTDKGRQAISALFKS